MEKASSESKALPLVLLSSVPIKLVKSGRKEEKNIFMRQQNRTQPYPPYPTVDIDKQQSLSERSTSCSNCNKQSTSSSSLKGSALLRSMIKSPIFILPIVTTKIPQNIYCKEKQGLHSSTKKISETASDGNNNNSCRVGKIFSLNYYSFSLLDAFSIISCSELHFCSK